MATITLLLGRTRDRRRRALRVEQWSGTDRLGRPNFLFITDSAHKKRVVQEEFVRYRNDASFLPEVATLSEVEARLAGRYVGGRAVWSEGAIAARLAAVPPEESPAWLAAAGPAFRTAPRMARAFMAWEAAGRPRLPGARGERLQPWLRSLAATLDADPSRRTRNSALRALLVALDSPSEALTTWLRRTGLVVIDDILNPPALDREVLTSLARAWAAAGTHVVIAFECGAGSAEEVEAQSFALGEAEERGSPTLRATARARRAVFDALIAEYGADVVVAGPEYGRSAALGPLFAPVEPLDPTDVWASDRPAEVGDLSLSSWPDPETEVRAIAHALRERLAGGTPAEDLCVAFPGLPAYAGLVRRIFTEVGIPYDLSRGQPLLALPAARTLAGVVRASLTPESPEPALDTLADAPAPLAALGVRLGRAAREAGLTRGGRGWRAELAALVPDRAGALAAALGPLEALSAAASPGEWLRALTALAEAWGLAALPGATPFLSAAEALVAEAHAARAQLGAASLSELLLTRLPQATVAAGPPREGAVAVVGMLELRGVHPAHTYIGGLLAEDFPASTGDDWVFDAACRETLELTDTMAEARYLLGSAVRNAAHTPGHSLHLSWPRMRARKFVLPSPVVEELLATHTPAGPLRDRVRVAEVPEGRFGAPEWERVAARLGQPSWLSVLPGELAARAEPVRARQQPAFGPWDGQTGRPPREGPISITAFETFLACPARFFYDQVLGVEEEEEWDPDLPAVANGALLHRVLQRFLNEAVRVGIPSLQVQEPAARARLASLLADAVATEVQADEALARLRPAQRDWLVGNWCSGLVDGGQIGLLRSWLDQESAAPPSTVLAAEKPLRVRLGPVELAGRADRVDTVGEDTLLVLDHKTGQVPTKKVQAGLKIQGVLYGRALATETRPFVVAGYAAVRAPGDVKRGGYAGPAAQVAGFLAPRAKALVTDGEPGAALDQWLEAAAARLARGNFHPSVAPVDLAGCEYCPHTTYCRRDEARALAVDASPEADVQRPFELPEPG